MEKLVGLSLFANIGVAEARLAEIGVEIAVSNEIIDERANFYQAVYPNAKMICGDITEKNVFEKIIRESKNKKVNFIIATPPCQGMSTIGKQDEQDERNYLIFYAIKAIKELKPKFVLLENVPQQLKTKILIDGKKVLISDYITKSLIKEYVIKNEIVNATDYGVPQIRKRLIYLMVRKDVEIEWNFINDKDKSKPISLTESIGFLPSLDPYIQGFSHKQLINYFPDFDKKREEGLKISKWHFPPTHKFRHVEVMKYTQEGKSALENITHYPAKPDGSHIKGYSNTYKRQSWNKPAYTITTYNGAICSQDNVHPGRYIGTNLKGEKEYSDPRVFSIYELMVLMTIPPEWPIPEWATESLIRHAIGEGIPSNIIKLLFQNLISEYEKYEKN